MRFAAILVGSTLFAGTALGAPDETGWTAYTAGRYRDAVALWRKEAGRGVTEAQFGLGIAHDLGRGVAPDSRAACDWYGRAGDGGHVTAAFSAGVMHDSGRCGPRRAEQAAIWYARAAAAGSPRAAFDLAQLYASGDGVPRNLDQAAAWYSAAAAEGITAATERAQKARTQAFRTDRVSAGVRSGDALLARGALLAADPVSPNDAQELAGGDARSVTLVWAAPPQPGPVSFFVELVAIEPSGPRELLGRYVDVSATQFRVPAEAGRYAWRVLTVATGSPHYQSGSWHMFTIVLSDRP